MQETLELSACGCPQSSSGRSKKHYHEIGAEVIGNQLLIRVEKDQKKLKRRQWEPPCDCEIPEIRIPSSNEEPKLINAGDNNQIIFRINSRSQVHSDDPKFRPEIISYNLGDDHSNSNERTIMVHPQLEGNGSQEIQRDHIAIGNQNIFMMRIKKKPDIKEHKHRNIELEVRYPKMPERIPTPPPPPPPSLPPPPPEPPKQEEEVRKDTKGKKAKKKK
ncbi:formin-I [Fopius arisanus]|uniref:Formin-I n=1 Tax=Fopius arisanus TaxID=64838 RepID=A0A0C9QPV4_9HYME|nr:PREDICTED: formin-I-like [Fopius arisanus]